jgi:hypothetical protein
VPDAQPSSAPSKRLTLSSLIGNFELVIAILLGLVSIATAYASFQAALYDSQMAGQYTLGNTTSTEAESLYLEGNQQFVQDTQLWNRLTELKIQANSADYAVASNAQETYDTLVFQAVSDEFAAAIEWADAQNAADPEYYYSPLDNEDYQDYLFSGYSDTKADSEQHIADGDTYNNLSDRLTLYTVLMSISLFLLGIAALVRQRRTQYVLVGTGSVIFVVALVMTLTIPFVGLG